MNRNLLQSGKVTLVTVVVISLLVLSGGIYLFTMSADAAGLTSVKAVLSNPQPATASNWTIYFVTDTLINEDDTIVLDFDTLGTPDQFNLGSIAFGDMDMNVLDSDCTSNSSSTTLAATATSGSWGATATTTTDTVTFTAPSNAATYIAATKCVQIKIGTNASTGGAGTNQITNPAKVAGSGTADIYDLAISFTGNAAANDGTALVAVIEAVTVSVTVDSSLSFTITGVASSSCTQGGSATQVTTTSTTVPFGSSGLSSDTFYKGCQDLAVGTNAASGYSLTAEENRSLYSATAATTIDDTLCDGGTCDQAMANSAAWTTATNNGFGYTCSGSHCNSGFNTAADFAQFACTGADGVCNPGTGVESPVEFAATSTPTSATTSRVVYKLSFDAAQAAGDYSNTVTYIATPTF